MKNNTIDRFEQILRFAKLVKKHCHHVGINDFLENELLQGAVMYYLGQIGETASKIPDDEQEKHPEIFWGQMIGLRHRLFHDYGEINLSEVYKITQVPITQLIENLEKLMK
jgi:uncharacterized protein with HEPN domain